MKTAVRRESSARRGRLMKMLATVMLQAVVATAASAVELTSQPKFVFVNPETSSLWTTATNSTLTVPIRYPAGATKAKLTVSGLGYSRAYADITGSECTFELPAATSPETENVYDLTLAFNDAASTVRKAKLGLIQGLSPDAEGATRCLVPKGSRAWCKVKGSAVLPIPYGMRTITVNGVDTDTGLDGARGWYALGNVEPNESVTLSGDADGSVYLASLLGGSVGFLLFLK